MYQMNLAPIAAPKSECAIETCYNWTIGPYFHLVRTLDLAPIQGASFLGGRFPGLKPSQTFLILTALRPVSFTTLTSLQPYFFGIA
jgi:hypothetical protein